MSSAGSGGSDFTAKVKVVPTLTVESTLSSLPSRAQSRLVTVSPNPAVEGQGQLTLLDLSLLVVKVPRASEELEELNLFFPRNPNPLIRHLEDGRVWVAGVGREADGDRLELRGVFHRIDEQVQQDLLQSLLVRAEGLGNIATLLQVDDDVLAVGMEVDQAEDLLQEDVDIEGRLLQDELLGLDAQVVLPLSRHLPARCSRSCG